MENRLASEEKVRRRLQQLAQSWDLLDQLPRTTVTDAFTRNTVEMVAQAAEQEMGKAAKSEPRRGKSRWLLTVLAAIAACLIGYFCVVHFRSDPNEELLRNFPVIQDQDSLKQAGSIDFLKKLDQKKLFSGDANDGS